VLFSSLSLYVLIHIISKNWRDRTKARITKTETASSFDTHFHLVASFISIA